MPLRFQLLPLRYRLLPLTAAAAVPLRFQIESGCCRSSNAAAAKPSCHAVTQTNAAAAAFSVAAAALPVAAAALPVAAVDRRCRRAAPFPD